MNNITPHKGGRTKRLSLRMTPEVWAFFNDKRNENKTFADVLEDLVLQHLTTTNTPKS